MQCAYTAAGMHLSISLGSTGVRWGHRVVSGQLWYCVRVRSSLAVFSLSGLYKDGASPAGPIQVWCCLAAECLGGSKRTHQLETVWGWSHTDVPGGVRHSLWGMCLSVSGDSVGAGVTPACPGRGGTAQMAVLQSLGSVQGGLTLACRVMQHSSYSTHCRSPQAMWTRSHTSGPGGGVG